MFKYLLKHIFLDTVYFPIWWYSSGLVRVLGWCKQSLIDMERTAALKIWAKAMFQPMFQDYTKSGRLISFFMRLVLLIFKLMMMGLWLIILGVIILIWLLLLPATLYLILKSFAIV